MSAPRSSRSERLLPIFSALLVGALLGWWLHSEIERGSSNCTSTAQGGLSESVQGSSAGFQEPSRTGVRDRARLFAELERAEAEESGRIVQIEDLAHSYGPGEFQQAAVEAQRVPLRYRKAYLGALTAEWAKTAPQEALRFADKISDREMSWAAINAAMTSWINTSQDAALAWVRGDDADSKKFAWTAVGVLQKGDPAKALAFMQTLPVTMVRPNHYEQMFDKWTKDNPAAASAAALKLPAGEVRAAAITSVTKALAEKDPRAAVSWLNSIPEKQVRSDMTAWVISTWSWKDPDAILAWANEQGDASIREQVQKAVWPALVRRDPAEARSRALALPEGEVKNEVLTTMALQRAVENLADAVDLIGLLPQGSAQFAAKEKLIHSIAQSEIPDPRAVCEVALSFTPERPAARRYRV